VKPGAVLSIVELVQIQIDPAAFTVALIAAGLAVWANVLARRAGASARKSAAEARRSADAAEDANRMAARERARALEVVDVAWSIEKSKKGDTLTIRNTGATTIHSVSAVVRVAGERIDVAAGDVLSDEFFECDAAHVFDQKRASNRAAVASMQASGITYFPSSNVPVEARISWQSVQGTRGRGSSHELDQRCRHPV
jgi:hypothetical protein